MADTRFKKGTSGNPSGRPKSDQANLRPLLVKHGAAVLQKVIDLALGGDTVACKIVLDRIYPQIKPSAATINIQLGNTLAETGTNILAATLDGEVAPDIGGGLMSSLTSQGKLVELEDLTKRLEALEQDHAENSNKKT